MGRASILVPLYGEFQRYSGRPLPFAKRGCMLGWFCGASGGRKPIREAPKAEKRPVGALVALRVMPRHSTPLLEDFLEEVRELRLAATLPGLPVSLERDDGRKRKPGEHQRVRRIHMSHFSPGVNQEVWCTRQWQ